MASKKKAKRAKKYKPKKQKTDKQMPPAPTANAKVIRDLMAANKVKGKFKDYVVIAGVRLIDWLGSYDILHESEDGLKAAGINGMALVHKSKLRNIIGEKMAAQFWRNGRRTNFGVESRRRGCATKQG
jgi:hypothetical protein